MLVYEHSHIELSYNLPNHYLYCKWRGTVLAEEALTAYKKGLNFIRKNDVSLWIDDLRDINLPPQEIISYLEQIWYPTAEEYELKKHAFLVKEMGIETDIFQDAIMLALKKSTIETKFFLELEPAVTWAL